MDATLMTQDQFNKLPLLLRRKEVVDCGIRDNKVDDVTQVLTTADEAVVFGKIGAVDCGGYKKYRKIDLARMCGFKI